MRTLTRATEQSGSEEREKLEELENFPLSDFFVFLFFFSSSPFFFRRNFRVSLQRLLAVAVGNETTMAQIGRNLELLEISPPTGLLYQTRVFRTY